MLGFPANPTDGEIYELEPGTYYIYERQTNSWMVAEGTLTADLATPNKSGLMSPDDFNKLNDLVLPPPQTTIKGEECTNNFKAGILDLIPGDSFVDISGIAKTAYGDIPRELHEHSHAFDFRLNLDTLIDFMTTTGRLKIKAPTGPQGPQGDPGDPGRDSLSHGPDGPAGDPGKNASFNITLTSETIPFNVQADTSKAVISVSTEEVSDTENYLVLTRANVGNPYACPDKLRIQNTSNSNWVLAFNPDAQTVTVTVPTISTPTQVAYLDNLKKYGISSDVQVTANPPVDCAASRTELSCNNPVYYFDINQIINPIRDKFYQDAGRIKHSTEQIVSFWLQHMSATFDEQKAALCCALENCVSRGRNTDTRRYLEQQRIQASQSGSKIIVDPADASYTRKFTSYAELSGAYSSSPTDHYFDNVWNSSYINGGDAGCALTDVRLSGTFVTSGDESTLTVYAGYDDGSGNIIEITKTTLLTIPLLNTHGGNHQFDTGVHTGNWDKVLIRVTCNGVSHTNVWNWSTTIIADTVCPPDRKTTNMNPAGCTPTLSAVPPAEQAAKAAQVAQDLAKTPTLKAASNQSDIVINLDNYKKVPINLSTAEFGYDITYASSGLGSGTLSMPWADIKTYTGKLTPGMYHLYIYNSMDVGQALHLSVVGRNMIFKSGNGAGWDNSYLEPYKVTANVGPSPGDGWLIVAEVLDESDSLIQSIIEVNAMTNSGAAKNGVRKTVQAGDYIVEIVDTDAIIGGKYTGHCRVQYSKNGKKEYADFQNFGGFRDIADSKNAYHGLTAEINHDGGDIVAYIPARGNNNAGSVTLKIIEKSKYFMANKKRSIDIKTYNQLDAMSCQIHHNHVRWYEQGWQEHKGCGCVVNIAGQAYIIIKRSIGGDIGCGGGEAATTPCIRVFQSAGHPAFAWPTFDGRTFVDIPTSGMVTFKYDDDLNRLFRDAVVSKNTEFSLGSLDSIRIVLFPVL